MRFLRKKVIWEFFTSCEGELKARMSTVINQNLKRRKNFKTHNMYNKQTKSRRDTKSINKGSEKH